MADYGLGEARTLIRQASVIVCELVNDCGATFHRRVAGAIASACGFNFKARDRTEAMDLDGRPSVVWSSA